MQTGGRRKGITLATDHFMLFYYKVTIYSPVGMHYAFIFRSGSDTPYRENLLAKRSGNFIHYRRYGHPEACNSRECPRGGARVPGGLPCRKGLTVLARRPRPAPGSSDSARH